MRDAAPHPEREATIPPGAVLSVLEAAAHDTSSLSHADPAESRARHRARREFIPVAISERAAAGSSATPERADHSFNDVATASNVAAAAA